MDMYDLLLAKSLNGGGSSGGGLFVVTVNVTPIYEETTTFWEATSDKTAKDVCDAIEAGLLPIVRLTGEDIGYEPQFLYLEVVDADADSGEYYAKFFGQMADISESGDDLLFGIRVNQVYLQTQSESYADYLSGYGTFPTE